MTIISIHLLNLVALVLMVLFVVQIGKSLCEMYIGVPRNYPQSPPVFLININRSGRGESILVHNIYNEQQLLKDQTIMIEKN